MMNEWKEVKLGDVCEIKYGKDHKKLKDGDIPVYGSGGIMRYVDTEIHNKKSVLIPRKGTLENLFLAIPPFWTVDTIFWTDIDTKQVTPEFLFYNMKTKNLAELNVGTAVPSLTTAVLNEVVLLLPPLPEQKAIADTLSCLDDKIELNNKINKNLEAQAQAIFCKFTHRNPVKSTPASEIVDICDGTHDSPKSVLNGHPLVTSKHLNAFSIALSETYLISQKDYEKVNQRSRVDYKDILISMIGTVGLISFVTDEKVDFAIKNIGVFKTSQKPELAYYLLCYLKSQEASGHIDACLAGSTQKYISLGELRKMSIPLIDENEILEFTSIVTPIFERIITAVNETQTLTTLRDTLLPKLMSGEIRVPVEVE